MALYRKRPLVIEAVQWRGDNVSEITAFSYPPGVAFRWGRRIEIDTLEGKMLAGVGAWIIRGVQGELYPCKPDIFAATYDPAELDVSQQDQP